MKRVDLIAFNDGDIRNVQTFETELSGETLKNLLFEIIERQIDPEDISYREGNLEIITVDDEMVDLFDRREGVVTYRVIAYTDTEEEETLDNESDIEYLNRMSNELDLPLEFRERLNGVLQGYYAAY